MADQETQQAQPLVNSNGRRLSRLHIQKRFDKCDITLNVFGEEPDEIFDLYLHTAALIVGEPHVKPRPTQAQREMANADAKAKQVQQKSAIANKPVCQECGTDESMELISWKDKATGELKKAWKCQSCNLWARKS